MDLQKQPSIMQSMRNEVQRGTIYKHYSGKTYKILEIAHYSEDPETLFVVYQGLYDCPIYGKNPVWCRPLSMFIEMVTVNQTVQPRFAELTKVSAEKNRNN